MANEIPGQIEPLVQDDRLTTPIWYEWFTYLRGIAKSVVSLLAFQANAEAAWISFTPTISNTGGTGPPVFTNNGCRYHRVGKTMSVFYDFTLTNLNGATGFLTVTLPVIATGNFVIGGHEATATGNAITLRPTGPTAGTVVFYNNTSTLVVNYRHIMGGTYEAA